MLSVVWSAMILRIARNMVCGFWILTLLAPAASACLYTVKVRVNLRKGPGVRYPVLHTLDHNRTLYRLSEEGSWIKVRTLTGLLGYVRRDMVSDLWLKVHKQERTLFVMKDARAVQTYAIALSPSNPLGDKQKLGDNGTPEGRFFICEMNRRPNPDRYGARSMRLSYPAIEDARRGLAGKYIDYKTYKAIVRSITAGKMPGQRTPLGGSIRIHGGGAARDWTLGCLALEDPDVTALYDRIGLGTRVDIYKSAQQDREFNQPGYLNQKIWQGARLQLEKPAQYVQEATGIVRLDYPRGDIPAHQAVCTDIVVRAFRHGGLDLQALLHESALVHPGRYKKWIPKPDYHIDHRRTRNLQTYLNFNSTVLENTITRNTQSEFKPGDIVIMDTGIRNGTAFDHIGILDNAQDDQGYPRVINIWTIGYHTLSMDLLGGDYPEVVGHFRLTHPFDYQ